VQIRSIIIIVVGLLQFVLSAERESKTALRMEEVFLGIANKYQHFLNSEKTIEAIVHLYIHVFTGHANRTVYFQKLNDEFNIVPTKQVEI